MAEYAHPEVLVETEWVAEHLDDPKIRLLESNEDVLLYETGHIPRRVDAILTIHIVRHTHPGHP